MISIMFLFFTTVYICLINNKKIMKERVLISTIMTSNVVKLNLSDSLTKAELLFKENNIRHIPVVSGSQIVGMLSHSDMLKIAIPDVDENDECVVSTVYNMFTLEQVMTKNVETLYHYDYVKTAAEIFSKCDFRALPIVDKDKNLVGILSTTDLIKFLLSQFNG